MIKIPFEDIIAKITEKSGLSQEEIDSRIQKKTQQLSGLISKEGAAHIIANELGIKLLEEVSGKLQIKNIMAGMRDVETIGKVMQIFPVREFETNGRQGKVASLVIGDETGSIRLVLWGDQTDNISKIKQNDIIKMMSGYVRENQGRKEIHLNDRSKIMVNPPGESVGEVPEQTFERPTANRKPINELQETDSNIEILGTIVQAFEPRFFEVCPECGKRSRMVEGEGYKCQTHGTVNPDYSYVFNAVIDDGTETIRTVFFRNQMERVLGMDKENILKFRESPERFDEVKNDLLGNQIKIIGRVNKNEMFDRLEFVSNLVDANPDPAQELKRLDSQNDV